MDDHDQEATIRRAQTGLAGMIERLRLVRRRIAAGELEREEVADALAEIETLSRETERTLAMVQEHGADGADPGVTTALDSSVVADVEYGRRVPVLTIRFQNDRVYHYYDVPDAVYRELMAAESKGQYFNREIRNRYPFQRAS